MNWYLDVLKKYAVFNGRARRSEYWYFVLFNIIISVILAVADFMTGMAHVVAGMGAERYLLTGRSDPEYRRIGAQAA